MQYQRIHICAGYHCTPRSLCDLTGCHFGKCDISGFNLRYRAARKIRSEVCFEATEELVNFLISCYKHETKLTRQE